MKTDKAFIIMATMMVVAMGILPSAQAALTGVANGWNYKTSMDAVSAYLYDLDNSHDANLSADTLSPDRSAPASAYSINDGEWADFNGPLSIHYGGADAVEISLRLHPGDDCIERQLFSSGADTFLTYDDADSNDAGRDLLQALYVVWDIHDYSNVTFCSANEPVTPNAPISASALLLFTGLIGIIGFRRRLNHE